MIEVRNRITRNEREERKHAIVWLLRRIETSFHLMK